LLEQARDVLEQQTEREPELTVARAQLGEVLHRLATIHRRANRDADARRCWERTLHHLDELIRHDTLNVGVHRSNHARTLLYLGKLLSDTNQPAEAIACWERCREEYTQLAAGPDPSGEFAYNLGQCLNLLGLELSGVGRGEEAQAALRGAVERLTPLDHDQAESDDRAVTLAGACCNLGNELAPAKPALPWFDRAAGILERVLRRNSNEATAKAYLVNTLRGRISTRVAAGQYGEASADCERFAALTGNSPEASLLRATIWARQGEGERAVALAKEAADRAPGNARQLYDAACVCALAAGADTARRDRWAADALELLGRAVRAGYANVEHLKRDPDLESIRALPGFQKLLAGLAVPGKKE
jgi:tetratricopeptide (TPR) repeat protein